MTLNERNYCDGTYARQYVERTLSSPYTIYKNETLASIAKETNFDSVLDLGCNVSPVVKNNGSLRLQMEQQGIRYTGLDLSFPYFDKQLASDLGVETYEQVDGIVGDMMNLPLEDSSVELITCADVLEHVLNPDTAFEEIARILSENGRALIVFPSMYKLDIADFRYIEEKRKSSHESKLTAAGWESKWEQAGLEVDCEKSRPLGIASGLSYLTWLNNNFVPDKKQLSEKETYSQDSELHKKTKEILSKYDQEIDELILTNTENASFIVQAIQNGNIQAIFMKLQEITNTIKISTADQHLLTEFFHTVSHIQFEDDRITELKEKFQNLKNPLLLIGNSLLVVLKKKTEAR